ncbi:MAG: hypothetical protein KGH94_04830 [Candidatus Micrarchaeota archaeon]|nr:hypothetical protein [Candidatus Micrarchaeota archaeon]
MRVAIRDDFMSFMQEDIASIKGPFFVTGCMDRRLTKIFDSMYREGSTIVRTAGGFLNGSQGVVEQLIKEYDTGIVTSHRGCGAAEVVVEGLKERQKVPPDIYDQVVNPFASKGCKDCTNVEASSPEMQKDYIEQIASLHGLGNKSIIMRCMDTPKPMVERPNKMELVITTPLRRRYSQLPGVSVNDDTKYYLHCDPSSPSLKCGVWIAVAEIKVGSIQVISQSPRENEMMAKVAETLKNDPEIQKFGVAINPPRLYDTSIKVGIPQKPGVTPRDRAKLF